MYKKQGGVNLKKIFHCSKIEENFVSNGSMKFKIKEAKLQWSCLTF